MRWFLPTGISRWCRGWCFCPGPGLVSMAAGEVKGLVFVLAMLMGMVVFEWLERMSAKTRTT